MALPEWKDPSTRGIAHRPARLVQPALRDRELNNAFYRLPTCDAFATWAAAVPDDFVIAVKAYLTQIRRLRDPAQATKRPLDAPAGLGTAQEGVRPEVADDERLARGPRRAEGAGRGRPERTDGRRPPSRAGRPTRRAGRRPGEPGGGAE
jgi:hypothetical protein